MFDDLVVPKLCALDDAGAVLVVLSLCELDVRSVGLPITSVEFSLNTDARDGGIDGRTDIPIAVPDSPIPLGRVVWQVKSGDRRPTAAYEFRERKTSMPTVRTAIADGHDYVLVWMQDVPYSNRLDLENEFREAAVLLRPGAEVRVLLAGQLSLWAGRTIAGLVAVGLPFAELRFVPDEEDVTYCEDIDRRRAASRIVSHLLDGPGSSLRVSGPPGVGKSRLIREAVRSDAALLDTLFAPSPNSVPPDLFNMASTVSRPVRLVVQHCSPEDAAQLESRAADTAIRLVTEGDDPAHSFLRRSEIVELGPLEPAVARRWLENDGISPYLAAQLVESVGGFPQLLLALAKGSTFGHQVESLPSRVSQLANVLIGRRAGLILALFGLIDVENSDTTSLCEAFSLTLEELEETVDAAAHLYLITDRSFVRLAPRAVVGAVIDGALERHLTSARHALQKLPDELAFRVFPQLRWASTSSAARISQDILERFESASVPLGGRGIESVLSTINNWSCVYHLNTDWVLGRLHPLSQRVADHYSEGSPSDTLLTSLKHLLFSDFTTFLQQVGATSSGFEVVITAVFRLIHRLPDYPTQGLATRLLSPGSPHEMTFPVRLDVLKGVVLQQGYFASSCALRWLNTDLTFVPGRQVVELMKDKIAPADSCLVIGFAVDLGERDETLLTHVAPVVTRHLTAAFNAPTIASLLWPIAQLRWPSSARPLIVAALGLAQEFCPSSIRDAIDDALDAVGPLITRDVLALMDQHSWSVVVGGDFYRSEVLCRACAKVLMEDSTGVASFLERVSDKEGHGSMAPIIAFEIGVLDSAGHWRLAFSHEDAWMINRAYLDGLSRSSQPRD